MFLRHSGSKPSFDHACAHTHTIIIKVFKNPKPKAPNRTNTTRTNKKPSVKFLYKACLSQLFQGYLATSTAGHRRLLHTHVGKQGLSPLRLRTGSSGWPQWSWPEVWHGEGSGPHFHPRAATDVLRAGRRVASGRGVQRRCGLCGRPGLRGRVRLDLLPRRPLAAGLRVSGAS